MSEFIPVNSPRLGGNELNYLEDCVQTGWVSSEGPFVGRFEQAIAELTGREHAIAVSSGTAALELAVTALGLGEGDEVILPAFTIISCAAAVVKAGATPVLVDCRPDTWTMDVTQVGAKITPRTKAIMAVHLYGLPVEMKPLLELAEQHGLSVVEDAAEAIGQECNGQPCGGFGDISVFSFYANKHVTCGEGGMVLTNDSKLSERVKSYRNLCFQPERRFMHDELGWNYRMTNLQAAVGLAQVEQLQDNTQRKRNLGAFYTQAFAGLRAMRLPVSETGYASNDYWVYGMVLEQSRQGEAAEVMRELSREGIGTRPFFWPMHEQPVLKRLGLFENECYPIAEQLARRGFYIPSGLGLKPAEAERVAERVLKVLG